MKKFVLTFGILALYFWGGSTLWKGFSRTNFNQSFATKLMLSAIWPVLFVGNKSFRGNFQ